MPAYLTGAALAGFRPSGYFSLVDADGKPTGRRIPGWLEARSDGGSDLLFVPHASAPVTFSVPAAAMPRPYRVPRSVVALRRVWRLPGKGRLVVPSPQGRVGFFTGDGTLVWSSGWLHVPNRFDTVGLRGRSSMAPGREPALFAGAVDHALSCPGQD